MDDGVDERVFDVAREALGQPAVRDRQASIGPQAHAVGQQRDRARDARHLHEVRERLRWELVVCVAVRQDKSLDNTGMARDKHLTKRAAGVVAHQRDVGQAELGDELADHVGYQQRRQVAAKRDRVRPERPVGRDAAVAVGQERHDLRPQRRVGEDPMDEQQHRAAALLEIGDPSRLQLHFFAFHQATGSSAGGWTRSAPTCERSSSRLPSDFRKAWVTMT